jgi:hypothetical protein
MGPRAGLDAMEKNPTPTDDRTRAVQPVAIPAELYGLLTEQGEDERILVTKPDHGGDRSYFGMCPILT